MEESPTVNLCQNMPVGTSSTATYEYRLLSIDPGSTKIGWAVMSLGPRYHASGVELVPQVPPDERIALVGDVVTRLIQRLQPDAVLIEIPDFIADRAIAQNLITYFRSVGSAEYATYLSGRRRYLHRASKNQRNQAKKLYMAAFQRMVGRPPVRDDESDAFCFAVAFLKAVQEHGSPPSEYMAVPRRTCDST